MPQQPGPPPPPLSSYPPRPPRLQEHWSPGSFSPLIFLVALVVIGLLVGVAYLSRRATSPDATPTAPVAASAQPGISPAPQQVFVIGNTGGEGVFLRRTPRLADRDKAYPDGTELIAIGADTTADGIVWHNVRAPDGRTGWVPAQYTTSR